MFAKLLVANRGEIAARIMRTCDRLGIATVAVYSDADWDAPHVRMAGEAVRLGPPRPSESYLDIEKIIAAAVTTGAQAIHPGYGFVSENPALAEACVAAGIAFVGPPASAMRALGDKIAARRLAIEQSVPVLPGFDIGEGDAAPPAGADAFPLMVKAAAGGGGRGMRIVEAPGELAAAIAAARREAAAAFGDGRLFAERAVIGGRHIEVQVIADAHGNAVHLGERDCSTQRRHQKVIEESPAPSLAPEQRARMHEAALAIVRAAGYVNAGTVEFLADRNGAFFFLEVNARLQVEHPVTEMVTGLDLVELQLRVAAGERLPLAQDEVRFAGHAIEARLLAEDPARNYLPASGRIARFVAPGGEGVRVDSGVGDGSLVPAEYDSLLAKIIAHGATRGDAIERCERALAATAVGGVRTNAGLLEAVLREPSFRAGEAGLDLLESLPAAAFAPRLPDGVLAAAAADDLAPRAGADAWAALGGWRMHGVVPLEYDYHGRTFVVTAARAPGGGLRDVSIDGRAVAAAATGHWHAEHDGKAIIVAAVTPPVTSPAIGAGELADVRAFIERSEWTFAKTMPQAPHWYTLRRRAPDETRFAWFVTFIRERGERRRRGKNDDCYLDVDGWSYWTMGAPLDETILINRARIEAGSGGAFGRYVLLRPPITGGAHASGAAPRAGELRAPMPGIVVRIMAAAGDRVSARQPLAVIEAMKMEHIIESSIDGVVTRVAVVEGARVAEGDILVEVASEAEPPA